MTYNQRIPKCDGVDIGVFADEGERVLDATGAADRAGLRAAAAGTFAVIAFGENLALAREPLGILEEARGMLAEGGRVRVCVPNVAHDETRAEVLDGAHRRFFTKKALEDLLLQAGFRIERMEGDAEARLTVAAVPLAGEARERMLWERYAAADVELVHARRRLAAREREAEQERERTDLAKAGIRELRERCAVLERKLETGLRAQEKAAAEHERKRMELQALLEAARARADAAEQRETHLIGYGEAVSAEYQAESERLALLIDTVQTSRFWRWKRLLTRAGAP